MNKYQIAIALLASSIFFLFTFSTAAAFEDNTSDSIARLSLNPKFSYKLLEPSENLRKVNLLFDEKSKLKFSNGTLNIGASVIAIANYQKSNTNSKFAYLMRHPTSANQIGTEVSEAVIHSMQLGLTGFVNQWLGFHSEFLYNPEQNFGQGTITNIQRNQFTMRSAFIMVGDKNNFPVYGAIGKMDAPFGQTGSVSPFSNSTMWHAFGGLCYGAQVGFFHENLNLTFMAAQGGAQFRAMNTPVGDSTAVPSLVNNFVGDANYTFKATNGVNVLVGASYMHGSAYCQNYPVIHFAPGNENNPASTIYGKLTYLNKIELKGGFAKTHKVWPGTLNPNPPLDIFDASKVSSTDYGARYFFNNNGKINYAASFEFSNFRAGPDRSPWERQNQYVFGLSGMINKSSKLFIEGFRTEGYVPLNWISGGNLELGETHSTQIARSTGIVIGGVLTL